MIKTNPDLKPSNLSRKLKRFWELSAEKINLIEKHYDDSRGSPVFTIKGNYTTRGWTEWTRGFQYGSVILHYDITGENSLLTLGRKKTVEVMAPHVFHRAGDYGRWRINDSTAISLYGSIQKVRRPDFRSVF